MVSRVHSVSGISQAELDGKKPRDEALQKFADGTLSSKEKGKGRRGGGGGGGGGGGEGGGG